MVRYATAGARSLQIICSWCRPTYFGLRRLEPVSALFASSRGTWPLELIRQRQQHNHMQTFRRRGRFKTFDPRGHSVARTVSFTGRRVDEVLARFVIIGRGYPELHRPSACPDRPFGHACIGVHKPVAAIPDRKFTVQHATYCICDCRPIGTAPRGRVAEWLRSGLQIRVLRFNSGRGLHFQS